MFCQTFKQESIGIKSKFRVEQLRNTSDICIIVFIEIFFLKNIPMEIKNSTEKDIDEIFRLYGLASEYQKSKEGVVVWPTFKRQLVGTEIDENRQWKLLINNQIACVWAIAFDDEQIWEEKNVDAAIYIHRIATNPDFRGNNFVAIIVEWAKEYATELNKDYVRLDTLGNNKKLIKYYVNAGFEFLGMFDLKNTDELPGHYKEAPACLFEINLNPDKKGTNN